MKIVFFPSGCLPFHAKTLEERPLGGMETAVIRLAEALQKLDHRVLIISGIDNPPLSHPLYLPMRAVNDVGPADVLIAVREWKPLLVNMEARQRFIWTGDSYDQPQTVGIGDTRLIETIDRLLPVSNWHGARLCEESGFPREKVWVLRNGIHLPFFAGEEPRHRKRLIYSSTPYRGLALLPSIFVELKKKHPELELHVFSGYKVYEGKDGYADSAVKNYEELIGRLSKLPGCVIHGNVKQEELAREFMRSTVLAYPNTFEETSCITAMEAQAAGCAIVTTAMAALPETVGNAGVLIRRAPGTIEYQQDFVSAVDRILSDDAYFNQLSSIGREQAKRFDWNFVAREFSAFLSQLPELR